MSPEFLAWYATQYEPIEFDGLTLMRMKQSAWDGWQAARGPGDPPPLFNALPNALAAITAAKANTAPPAAVQPEKLRDALTELATVQKKLIEANAEIAALNLAASVKPDSRRDAALCQYGYQQLFDAIAAATKIEGAWISISAAEFRNHIAAYSTENAAVQSLTDVEKLSAIADDLDSEASAFFSHDSSGEDVARTARDQAAEIRAILAAASAKGGA